LRTHGKWLPISRGVARRTVTALALMRSWIKDLYREVTDGGSGFCLGRMVKIIVGKIGGTELSNRWYRHRYPQRFGVPQAQQHNMSLVNKRTVR